MFGTYEISSAAGRPVGLYTFQYGNTVWRYCTADEDLTLAGPPDELGNAEDIVFTALAITDAGVTQGGSDQNDLSITTQQNLPIALLFRNSYPTGKVWLTVQKWHWGDDPTETPIIWKGTITNAQPVDEAASVTLIGRSLGGTYDKQGLRLSWSRQCGVVLYGYGCNRNNSNPKSAHAYARTISAVTGAGFSTVETTGPAEGTFTGGFVEFVRPDGSPDRRAIESWAGNNFGVLGSTVGLVVGATVTLYPGCARNTTACKAFGNLPNYGGFPHLPGKSPFDGSPVF